MATSNPHIVAITGASAGIGLATARELARRGDTVVLSARRADRLHDIAREITAAGGRALDLPGDVTSESDMTALVAKAVNTFGRLDVMICNAGIGYHGPLDETPPDAMRRLVDVNIMGTLYAARAAMIAMRRQGHGHIIAISSIVGRRGIGGSSVYAATKAAQLTFIESLRAEFVGSAFHASVVFPVRTETEFRDAIERDFGHVVGGVGPSQPAERVGRAIADCVGRPRAEVYPFGRSRLLAILGVIAPAQTDRLVQRFGRHGTPRPSTDDAGRA